MEVEFDKVCDLGQLVAQRIDTKIEDALQLVLY